MSRLLTPGSILSFLIVLALLLAPRGATAHELRTAYVSIEAEADTLRTNVLIAVVDLSSVLKLDSDQDGEVTMAELDPHRERATRLLAKHVEVKLDGQVVPQSPGGSDFSVAVGGHVLFRQHLVAPLRQAPKRIDLRTTLFDDFGQGFKVLARITQGEQSSEEVLSGSEAVFTFSAAKAEQGGVDRPSWSFIRLGIEHIFIGIDHILFLLALIVLGGRFRDLIKIVTAFTVAHSVTLAVAALGLFHPPGRLIESAIALSIVYVAGENLVIQKTDWRWVITAAFGLIHGFGFANVLAELGLPRQGLVLSLLAFNLGVEIGQVCIVALMWPLVVLLSRLPRRRLAVSAVSVLIGLIGLGWFIERAFGVELGLP